MNKKRLYSFLDKHLFIKYMLFGILNRKNKDVLNEKIGLIKNNFTIHTYGEKNYGKIIYNIRIEDKVAGFFALNRYVLDALYCADMMGFVPFVSLIKSHYNDSADDNDNMFEYYYKQNEGITIDDVKQSYAVAEYKSEHRQWLEDLYKDEDALLCGYDFDIRLINKLAEISKKRLILRDDVRENIKNDMSVLSMNERTIGIHYRGNAYKVGFYGHPIALEIEDYYAYIDECINTGFNQIFIATDDNKALQKLIERYSNRVLFYNDTERSDDGIDVHDRKNKCKTGRRLGYEVLRDMYTLSCCDALICGKSQVSFAVLVEKQARDESFSYFKLIDRGLYEKDCQKNIKNYVNRIS